MKKIILILSLGLTTFFCFGCSKSTVATKLEQNNQSSQLIEKVTLDAGLEDDASPPNGTSVGNPPGTKDQIQPK